MKRSTLLTLTVLLMASSVHASLFNNFSQYMYVSQTEETRFDEIIWFWSPDTMYGAVHSNGFIGIMYAPHFYGPVFTGEEQFIGPPEPGWFNVDPYFNFPQIAFPDSLHGLREEAAAQGQFFSGEDSTLQFRCTTDGDRWEWMAWSIDEPFDSAQVERFGDVWFGEDNVLFFDGPLQILGEEIAGSTTIGASGDVIIMDNLLYAPYTTDLFPEELPDTLSPMLGLASERDILVGNTFPNGRGNGYNNDGTHDGAHVIIMAALLALGDEFTFQNHNDTWDDYIWCDPEGEHHGEQDERGTIYLLGSLSNYRRGYVHRSNCGGTGYAKDYMYDFCFSETAPPHFPEIDWVPQDNLVQDEVWQDTTVTIGPDDSLMVFGELTWGPGTEVIVDADAADTPIPMFGAEFHVDGAPDNPVVLELEGTGARRFGGGFSDFGTDSVWTHFQIHGPTVDLALDLPPAVSNLQVEADSLTLLPVFSVMENDSAWVDVDSSVLRASQIVTVSLENPDNFRRLSRSELTGAITNRFDTIDHCTILLDNAHTLHNALNNPVEIINTCITGGEQLISADAPVTVSYSAYQATGDEPFSELVTMGEGILENVDPQFVDPQAFDYRLLESSPMIDAGASAIPDDPDGTRSDIGAFYFDQLPVGEQADDDPLPGEFAIEGVFPNPFNPTTEIRIALPRRGVVQVEVIDILGRRVATLHHGALPPGHHTFTFNGSHLASGTYFVRALRGSDVVVRKIVLLK